MSAELADGAGFGQTGRPLNQQVAVGQQGDEEAFEQLLLADDLFTERGVESREAVLYRIHAKRSFIRSGKNFYPSGAKGGPAPAFRPGREITSALGVVGWCRFPVCGRRTGGRFGLHQFGPCRFLQLF